MDKLTKGLQNLEVEKSETVTDILEDFRGLLDRNKIDPNKGIRNMFERSTKSERIDIKLTGHAKSALDRGNLLQYLIYEYLKVKEGFQAECSYKEFEFEYEFDSEMFGAAVMKLIQVEAETKLLEADLLSKKFKARGHADFYTCGGEGPSILIDFKWTSDDYPDPSPGYALQLLLYQWLAGQRFEEERGAMMYLIRFVESTGDLQLIPFNPPEDMQYSKDSAGGRVKSYKDIVRLFLKKYYPELPEDSYKEMLGD